MKERRAYKIYWLEDWRREKLAGVPWEIRMIGITGIVWVPIVGITTAVFVKAVGGFFVRIIIWGFTGIRRGIFH